MLSEDWRRLSLAAGSFLKTWKLARWRRLCKHPTFPTIWSNELRHLKRHPSCFYMKLSSDSNPWHIFNRRGFNSRESEIRLWQFRLLRFSIFTSPIFTFTFLFLTWMTSVFDTKNYCLSELYSDALNSYLLIKMEKLYIFFKLIILVSLGLYDLYFFFDTLLQFFRWEQSSGWKILKLKRL